MRRIFTVGLLALGLAACSKNGEKSGPVVAKGKGFEITAGEFKARIEEQSPFMRARYNTLDRKKEFLDNLVRFEVLAAEAKRQGLDKDADVQLMVKRFMVNKLVQKSLAGEQAKDANATIPDADAQKYYDEHKSEYQRPKRIHAAALVFLSEPGTPKRAKDLVSAKKALADFRKSEKKNPMEFNHLVTSLSEDAASRNQGGDLGFRSEEDYATAFSPEFAKALVALKNGETSGVIETPKGVYLVRNLGQQDEVNRTFEQVKPQIQAKLTRDHRQKEFEDWMKRLKDEANVQVYDQALDTVTVSSGLPIAPGMTPGMSGMPPHGMPGRPMPMGTGGSPAMPFGRPPMSVPAPAPAAK